MVERDTVKVLFSGGVHYVPVLAPFAKQLKFNKGTKVRLGLGSGDNNDILYVERVVNAPRKAKV
jgi:hypothetical protein